MESIFHIATTSQKLPARIATAHWIRTMVLSSQDVMTWRQSATLSFTSCAANSRGKASVETKRRLKPRKRKRQLTNSVSAYRKYLPNICIIAASNWSLKTLLITIICCHCLSHKWKLKMTACRSSWSIPFSFKSSELSNRWSWNLPRVRKSGANTRLTITPMPVGWTNPNSSLLLQISRQTESSLTSTSIRLKMSHPKFTWGRNTHPTIHTCKVTCGPCMVILEVTTRCPVIPPSSVRT